MNLTLWELIIFAVDGGRWDEKNDAGIMRFMYQRRKRERRETLKTSDTTKGTQKRFEESLVEDFLDCKKYFSATCAASPSFSILSLFFCIGRRDRPSDRLFVWISCGLWICCRHYWILLQQPTDVEWCIMRMMTLLNHDDHDSCP